MSWFTYVEVSRHWSIYGRRSVRVSDHIFTSWPFKLSRTASEQQSNARPRPRSTFSAGPPPALTPLLSVDVVQSFRIEETVTRTRDVDTWHVTRDNVSWGASPSVPPVQEVPRARGRGAAGPGHPAPPAQWPARHRTLRLEKYWKF